MPLLKCESLWGEANIMYGNPPVREVTNAKFIPFSSASNWGVYDHEDRLVSEAVDVRGSSREPLYKQDLELRTLVSDIEVSKEPQYIYCGLINPHFGHFLINTLSRFWQFHDSEKAMPNILCAGDKGMMMPYAVAIFNSLGIDVDAITFLTAPTLIPSLIVPTTSFWEQYWAYTVFKDLCNKSAASILAHTEADSVEIPVYLSKSRLNSGVGRFADEVKVESVLRSAGVDIVYPEMLSFAEQIRLFTTRQICMGPTGSAFHTSIFAKSGRNIVCFNPSKEVNSNFSLIDKLNSNNSIYFYQEGMTYESNKDDFLTVVNALDYEEIAEELLSQAEIIGRWRGR